MREARETHTEPTLNPPSPAALGPVAARGDLVGIGTAAGAGIALVATSVIGLVRGTIVPWLGSTLAILGIAVLVAVAGVVGWSLARRRPPVRRRSRPGPGPAALVFACGDAPQVSWLDRLVELDRDVRRDMALRVPSVRRGVRWLADLLQVLEHHHGTLERLVLVTDRATYPGPVRAALDRLIRSHADPLRGEAGPCLTIEHLELDEPDDPEQVFAAVSGKLHELALRHRRRRLAVAPTAGSSPTDMALTLAASVHGSELVYFRGTRGPDEGPEHFSAVS